MLSDDRTNNLEAKNRQKDRDRKRVARKKWRKNGGKTKEGHWVLKPVFSNNN